MNRQILKVGLIIASISLGSTASALSTSRSVVFTAPNGGSARGIVNSQSPGTEGPLIVKLSVTSRLFEEGPNVDTQSKSCLRKVSTSGFLTINCTATAIDNSLHTYCEYCVDGFVFVISSPIGPGDSTLEIAKTCKRFTPPDCFCY
jgi:hypothetical protein